MALWPKRYPFVQMMERAFHPLPVDDIMREDHPGEAVHILDPWMSQPWIEARIDPLGNITVRYMTTLPIPNFLRDSVQVVIDRVQDAMRQKLAP